MNMVAVTFIWTLGILLYPGSFGDKEIEHQTDLCKHTLSCSDCIKSHPSCVWCSAKNFTEGGESEGSRCATRLELLQRGCDEEHVIEPKGLVLFLKDEPLSDNADEDTVTQLAPQKVSVKLRLGEKRTFQVRFKRAEGYPIDLYYLMDLSYSMKDDLENVKKLGSDIQEVLHKVTKSVRIGFGSFVDKTVLPFVNTMKWQMQNPCPSRTERCQPPFSYRHVLSLTSNLTLFQQRVSAENISGNLDTPEGGFDAILQAAVCTDHIGWRNVTRLLVFASDDVFHMAGDGKLAGIYIPTDGRCHLNDNGEYHHSNMFDYPSVGHLSQVLTAANIQPIFAVTSNVLSTYQGLSELIPKSAVGELKADSSNVVNLISQAYNNLSSTVNLEHVNLPKGIHISYSSNCPDTTKKGQPYGLCSGVKINQMVDFNVTLWMDEKICQDGVQSFKLRVLGFSEEINVDVEPVCHCDCKDGEAFSDYCTGGSGNYSCGICSCKDGYKGKHCECNQNRPDSNEGCKNGSLTCNGRGKCECGRCACNKHVRGLFCECDDASCERYEGQLCGGLTRGVCSCGTCKCAPIYTGTACGCSLDNSTCMTPDGICSGHGKCECNKCVCDKGYFNRLCSDCPGCQTPCQKYSTCVECKAFSTGPLKENCSLYCTHVNVTMLKATEWNRKDKDGLCQEKGEGGSVITFHTMEDGDLVHIIVKEKQEFQDHTQQLILGLVLGIVFFGLLVILLYRVTVEVYDRKEYGRFMKARSQEQWNDAQNPLYKSATTTVVNPNFNQE
ncbi:integrin beta-7 isoform X2 [Phyllobates terribilis]|uniref:integrin beta-7 isoform X2 n=2 Tax=Phyllobates terribilis TaxID=111132 RepID=UPI003CCB2B81